MPFDVATAFLFIALLVAIVRTALAIEGIVTDIVAGASVGMFIFGPPTALKSAGSTRRAG